MEDTYYNALLPLVLEAGSVVREGFNKAGTVVSMTKSSDIDLVTETDQKVERMLIDGLRSQFPDHRFIGEESSSEHGQKNQLTSAPTWIIDPVDGTTNFVHKFPFTCISVGLYINERANLGVVYNPILNELFTARSGQGAFKNGFPIHCSKTQELSKSLVLLTLGLHNIKENNNSLEIALDNNRRIVKQGIRGHRSLGSAALNMCYVASGCADAYVEYGIHCWDMAAAGLIVEEAGGCLIDPKGTPFDLMSRRVLCAATKELASQLSGLLVHIELPRDD